MTGTLVNDLTGLFKNQALGEAASQLGESESSVLRGFEAASSAIMGGLASHLGQTGFMRQVYDLISSPLNDGGMLSNIRGFFANRAAGATSDGLGGKMLSLLFGSDQSKITETISQASGLRASSASTIMAAAAPMVLGLLGRRVQENHLDVSGFSSLLQSETAGASSTVTSTVTGTGRVASGIVHETARVVEPVTHPNRWLWPLLLAVLAIIGLFWFLNRSKGVVDTATEAVRSTAASLGEFFKTKLPSGVELSIPRYGVEARLLSFIQDSSKPIDSTSWFDFDRLNFDTNSATLRPESHEQLSNIAAILTAYPTVRVKIGGYTDNTGDSAANLQLSQARADSVRQELINMGIGADRVEAKGYGDQHSIADNSTEAGKLKNRRVAIEMLSR